MELRACYFCGSPGGLDTYPVVPESITSRDASDDPAEVVLCPDCHAKLERVLDGVLGAVDADVSPAADADASSADSAGISEITFDEADASDPAGEAGDGGEDGGTEGTDADAAGIDVVPDSSTGVADASGDAESSSAESTDEAAPTEEDGPTDEDDGADGGSDSGSSGGLRGLGNSGAGQYRQALRLLRNRDFPMSRSDVIDVMSSAYDLSRAECDRLVDLAVERGSLTDDGGVLRQD